MEEQLKEILDITKENNKILRGMRRSQRWTSFLSLLYWVLIIGSVVGGYYLLQPTIDTLRKQYDDVLSKISGVSKISESLPNANVSPEAIESLRKALDVR